jgi:hypothetical protein
MRAAIEVATQLGLHVDDPVLIQETNNTVVWLRPHPIIAKVGTHDYSAITLNHEYDVASSLTVAGAPIASPWGDVGPVSDPETGYVVTLWCRQDTETSAEPNETGVGHSLRLVHDAMTRINVQLPSFRDGIAHAQSVLAKDAPMSALAGGDRDFLRHSFAEL